MHPHVSRLEEISTCTKSLSKVVDTVLIAPTAYPAPPRLQCASYGFRPLRKVALKCSPVSKNVRILKIGPLEAELCQIRCFPTFTAHLAAVNVARTTVKLVTTVASLPAGRFSKFLRFWKWHEISMAPPGVARSPNFKIEAVTKLDKLDTWLHTSNAVLNHLTWPKFCYPSLIGSLDMNPVQC